MNELRQIIKLQEDVKDLLEELNVKRRKERLLKRRERDNQEAQDRIKASMPEEPRVYVMN